MSASTPARTEDLGLVDGLVQTSMLVQAVFADAAAAHDLSPLQARLLGVLRDREPTMADVRRLLDLDKSSTTGLVDRAERRGLVRRAASPCDGRSFQVLLTDDGRRIAQDFVAAVGEQLTTLAEDLGERDRNRLSALLSSVVRRHAAAHDIDLGAGIDRRRT
ncbi:MarR family winged helix-turn-helix transcriptional regulator [Actinomycetospora termitidis]|uniref:MarR family transcriptional regulator n=1 Tax=Actinomycetospora termitidis TaxID=3053470 RepID=A0ABT7M4M2_9PSEU|nr:MarR family transcriptional regulator [Actinomycetospora sp. Odt1-22]MDL5155625.1 MarR family transcriptional regulator [Actinomycetospora sp. Odt1-22]